jgi:hypothetical protein
MKKSWISLVGVTAAFALVGCGKSGSSEYKPVPPKKPEAVAVAPGQEATLFPVAVGNRWSFDTKSEVRTPNGNVTNSATITLEVKEATPPDANGVSRATIEVFKGEVLQDRQIWVFKSDGIFQEQLGLDKPVRPDPMQLTVPFPIEIDKAVPWTGKAMSATGSEAQIEQEIVNKGPEDVDTIVGMLNAYRVETTQKFMAKTAEVRVTNISWWAPKIGLVRYKQETKVDGRPFQSQTMLLKQYTVK